MRIPALTERGPFFGLILACSVACGGAQGPTGELGRVDFSDEDWAALKSLRMSENQALPEDVSNRFADSGEAARFGKTLFFYPGFAGPLLESDNDGTEGALGVRGDTGRVACSSCHLPESGFADSRSPGQQISLAAGWTERHTPSLLNVGARKLLTWDGKADTLFGQIFGVIENPLEMNSSRLFVAQQAFRTFRTDYEALFGPMPELDDTSRFPELTAESAGCDPKPPREDQVCRGRPGDGDAFDSLSAEDQDQVTEVVVNLGKALGAYQRKLTCGPGRFDRFVDGDEAALTAAEQRGAKLFVGKGKCFSCHSGPYLSDFGFHNVGLKPVAVAVAFISRDDEGAQKGLAELMESPLNSEGPFSDGSDGRIPSELPEDALGSFATPGLRCLKSRPSFFHTGQVRTLRGVIEFFDRGGNEDGFLGEKEIEPLGLSADERDDLLQFLESLEGEGPDTEWMSP